jgi:hypothetical protein
MTQRLGVLTLGASLVFAGSLLQLSSSAASAARAIQARTCSITRLSITVASASAAGGTEGMLIAFRNKSATTCVLQGYPKVVATRSETSSLAIPSLNTYLGGLDPGLEPPLVRLEPGRTASVVVAAGDNPRVLSSPCVNERYKAVTVSLPGQSGSKKLSAELPREATSLPSCSRVDVTPFQSGLTWFGN